MLAGVGGHCSHLFFSRKRACQNMTTGRPVGVAHECFFCYEKTNRPMSFTLLLR